jgi:hypothetical protein
MSELWFLAITLIILGALGYIEQLFGFKWSRRTLVLLLASYLLLSFGQQFMQSYEDNKEREQARRSEERLRQELAASQQQQAAAEQALRKVQEQQRPRRLTEAQFFSLLPQLHNGPKGRVKIGSPVGDAEAERFADLFYGVLATVGWTTERNRVLQLEEPPVGLKLDVGRADMAPHGEFLRQILQGIGLEVSYLSDQDVPEGVVLFTVGQKPWPRN